MNELDRASVKALAQLLGQLLIYELDEETRASLVDPETAEALASVGLDVSKLAPQEELDAQFLDTFLIPKSGGPLVQSLWTQGSYEGDSAVAIRKLAEAVGADFDLSAARGAAHDHLGCILLLWAEVRDDIPEAAERLEADHLNWALDPLDRIAAGDGFYADLASVVASFLRAIGAGDFAG